MSTVSAANDVDDDDGLTVLLEEATAELMGDGLIILCQEDRQIVLSTSDLRRLVEATAEY